MMEMERPAVDAGTVAELRELGGDELLADLIDTYLSDAVSLLTQARASLAAGDAPTLRRAVHTLKSASAGVGAHALAAVCARAEALAADGDVRGAGPLVEQAEAEWTRVYAAFAGLRPQPLH